MIVGRVVNRWMLCLRFCFGLLFVLSIEFLVLGLDVLIRFIVVCILFIGCVFSGIRLIVVFMLLVSVWCFCFFSWNVVSFFGVGSLLCYSRYVIVLNGCVLVSFCMG